MIIYLLFLNIVASKELFSYGTNNELILPKGYNIITLDLTQPIIFFNNVYSKLHLHSDGFIILSNNSSNRIHDTPLDNTAALVLYWSKTDTNLNDYITFREISHPYKLKSLSSKFYSKVGNFTASFGFIVTWFRVREYNINSNNTNTFQLMLLTDGFQTWAVFNYNEMMWRNILYNYEMCFIKNMDEIKYSIFSDINYLQKSTNINRNGIWVFRIDGLDEKNSSRKIIALNLVYLLFFLNIFY